MDFNLEQNQATLLTIKLELKIREYMMLCKKLDKVDKSNVEELTLLKDAFLQNLNDLQEINNLLKELHEDEENAD